MKTLGEAQQDMWQSINASLKAAGAEALPEHHRSVVNLATIELYNALKAPPTPKSAIEEKLEKLRKKAGDLFGPVAIIGAALFSYKLGQGQDLTPFMNGLGLVAAAVLLWALVKWVKK